MSLPKDPLYSLCEQHLFNALVEEETTQEFLDHVVREYMLQLRDQGSIPPHQVKALENDLRGEGHEMLRKKTYGHYSISHFRKQATTAATKAPIKSVRRRPQ